jgi:hypothetical protein
LPFTSKVILPLFSLWEMGKFRYCLVILKDTSPAIAAKQEKDKTKRVSTVLLNVFIAILFISL